MKTRFDRTGLQGSWMLLLSLSLPFVAAPAALAAQSTGGVNWIDPLGYAKPKFVPLNLPDEATVAHKYWVDMSGGSGSTCSQSAPCKSLDNVLGKPGTQGGPAIIYLKGRGQLSLYNDTLYGSGNADCRTQSCAGWILIRTWPAGSPGCASEECTATITGDSNMNSPNLHHIVWDGGPDLKIRFDSNISGSFAYVQNLNSDWHIVYRTQTYCSPGANGARGFQVGSSRSVDHVSFINNEFHSCESVGDQTSSVYVGAGSNGGYTNFLFQNNIVRGMYGEGIEINPRVTSSNATIIGNAFHDVGLGTCSTPWKCRPAITMSIQSGGGNNGTVIANNMIWNTGSSCIYDRGGGNPRPLIQNNTCFNHGMGTMPGGQNNPQGITGYSSGGTATVQNNIIYSPSGIAPFDASAFSASNNLCAPGASCGSAKQSYSAATFLSTDPNSPLFLQIGPGSEARNKGMPIAGVSGSYNGVPRPQEGAHDIGAHELASGDTTAPVVPGGLKVLR